jgi:hypothetical protein
MTTQMDDYVNHIVDGVISYKSISYCASYSEEGLEHWQQIIHEVSTRGCAHITDPYTRLEKNYVIRLGMMD